MRFVVLGGGCYGSFYSRQLLRAADAGAVELDEIVVVDNAIQPQAAEIKDARLQIAQTDWDDFFDSYFAALSDTSQDQIVPPPFTPHLALAWLLRSLESSRPDFKWTLEPFRRMPGTPFQQQSAGGPLVLSHADWLCPVHCIEPDMCPKIRAPRDWDMAVTAQRLAAELADEDQPVQQVHLFCCHHLTYGVGTYPASDVLRARNDIQTALKHTKQIRVLIGTVSRCHGALNLLVGSHGMEREATNEVIPTTPEGSHHPTSRQ